MRNLLVTADDFGMGPRTTEGILWLAQRGLVTSSVLMANSPFAREAVQAWIQSGKKLELGWHLVLTHDRPVLPPEQVPSLVDPMGKFLKLNTFLRKLFLRQICRTQLRLEIAAQFERCTELLGQPPSLVNGHHHIHIFQPVAAILQELLLAQQAQPFLRIVREPWSMLAAIPGARPKRLLLNYHGLRAARRQRRTGLLANDWLVGVTDAKAVNSPDFFTRLIRTVPGRVVELMCHPGLFDSTLIGRDCTASDGMLERRVQELHLLSHPSFLQACAHAGFTLISPSQHPQRSSASDLTLPARSNQSPPPNP